MASVMLMPSPTHGDMSLEVSTNTHMSTEVSMEDHYGKRDAEAKSEAYFYGGYGYPYGGVQTYGFPYGGYLG